MLAWLCCLQFGFAFCWYLQCSMQPSCCQRHGPSRARLSVGPTGLANLRRRRGLRDELMVETGWGDYRWIGARLGKRRAWLELGRNERGPQTRKANFKFRVAQPIGQKTKMHCRAREKRKKENRRGKKNKKKHAYPELCWQKPKEPKVRRSCLTPLRKVTLSKARSLTTGDEMEATSSRIAVTSSRIVPMW